MAKKVVAVINCLNAGKPITTNGTSLGQHGVNIMMFCKNTTPEQQIKSGW